MFRLADPSFLLLLPLLGVAAWFVYRRRRRSGLIFSRASDLAGARRSWRQWVSALLPAMILLGIAACIVALARPQTVISRSHRATESISIQMVVDVSGSMEALDLSDMIAGQIVKERTRLDVVKDMFARFVEQRPDDLIGLVTFGGYASTRCPLTIDHSALLQVLKAVEIPRPAQDRQGQIVNQEELLTAVGDALATGCARMQKAETRTRIIVLLSDGESNTGIVQPMAAAGVAKKLGIRVYTIGVGSTGVAPFRGRDIFGRQVYQNVEVTMDEDMLRKIAAETGGTYFGVRDPKGLEKALAEIDKLEKTRVEREIHNQYHEWFPWALAPGLALVALGAGLGMLLTQRVL